MRFFKRKKTNIEEKTLIENESFYDDFEDEDSDYIEIQEGGVYEELEERTHVENVPKEKHSLDYFLNEANEFAKASNKVVADDDFNLLDR